MLQDVPKINSANDKKNCEEYSTADPKFTKGMQDEIL
jgi:hypothetical protein